MSNLVRILLVALTSFAVQSLASAAEKVYDIRDYGATPGGETLCTAAIQKAIDQCAAAGGGTVYFPPGVWLSGTIELRSRVALKLEAGSRLLGSANPADYPDWVPKFRSFTKYYTRQSLIRGEDLEHVAICGQGTIDGNGTKFPWRKYTNRPFAILLASCRDVLVEGIAVRDSAMWMQEYLACDGLRIHGITVNNHVAWNNDGVDLDCCRNAVVSDCRFDTDDDGICLKSTGERPCENITITNCVVSSYCCAIKTGTESNGGFRNVTISNCTISSPTGGRKLRDWKGGLAGVALILVDGGALENVAVSNLTIDGVKTPILMLLANRGRPFDKALPKPGVGTFRNVAISNIVATGISNTGCSIIGMPGHCIENVQLNNIQVISEGGGTRNDADKMPSETEDANPHKMGSSVLYGASAAYGLSCRYVTGLTLRDVRLRTAQPDLRHAVVAKDVADLVIDGLDVRPAAGAAAAVRLIHSPGAVVRNSGNVSVDQEKSSK